MAHCRGKYNWIPGESNDKDGRSHKIQNTHQCRKFHTRRKISCMRHWKLLLRNTDGTVGVYYNKYQVNYARHYWKLQLKRPSQSRCMDSHGNNIRNVWTTTSGNYYKQLTYTTFKQPWILPGKKNTWITASYLDHYNGDPDEDDLEVSKDYLNISFLSIVLICGTDWERCSDFWMSWIIIPPRGLKTTPQLPLKCIPLWWTITDTTLPY